MPVLAAAAAACGNGSADGVRALLESADQHELASIERWLRADEPQHAGARRRFARALLHLVRTEAAPLLLHASTSASSSSSSLVLSSSSYPPLPCSQAGHPKRITPTLIVERSVSSLTSSAFASAAEVPDVAQSMRHRLKTSASFAWMSPPAGPSPPPPPSPPLPCLSISRTKGVARLLAEALSRRLVPHLLDALHLLVCLLLVPSNAAAAPKLPTERRPVVLVSVIDCVELAAGVLSSLPELLCGLGHECRTAILESPQFAKHCPNVQTNVRAAVNAALLHPSNSFSEDELLGREQSFRSELDSRHRFSSREHQRLYANREKFRDAFYLLMKRDYAMDRSGKAFRTEALALFDELSDANLSWFSALFVSELMNQCWSDTSWLPLPVQSFAGSDKKKLLKLQKLSRRVTTPNASFPASNHRLPKATDSKTSQEMSSLNDSDYLFPGVQGFFYRFLCACDRFRFNTLVMNRLAAKINELATPPSESRRTLTARAVKLMFLAKFLGFLMFSPRWPSATLIAGESAHSAALRESVRICEQTRPLIDVNLYLERALSASLDTLVYTIPWTCELLKMMHADISARSSSYYAHSFSLLAACSSRSLLDANSQSSLCVIFAIEELFLCLDLDLEQLAVLKVPASATTDNTVGEDHELERERIFFSSCPLLQQIVQLLRRSCVPSKNAEPSRLITPSRREPFKSPPELALWPRDTSVKRNSDLRSQFFLHNSEFASTIPFVLEHIVPNSVDVAIAESVDEVTKAAALSFVRIRPSGEMPNATDEENLFASALVSAQQNSVLQSHRLCRERLVAALGALTSRKSSGNSSGTRLMESRVIANAVELAISHSQKLVDERVSVQLPLALQAAWQPMLTKARKSLAKATSSIRADGHDHVASLAAISTSASTTQTGAPHGVAGDLANHCRLLEDVDESSLISLATMSSASEAFVFASTLLCKHADPSSDVWRVLSASIADVFKASENVLRVSIAHKLAAAICNIASNATNDDRSRSIANSFSTLLASCGIPIPILEDALISRLDEDDTRPLNNALVQFLLDMIERHYQNCPVATTALDFAALLSQIAAMAVPEAARRAEQLSSNVCSVPLSES